MPKSTKINFLPWTVQDVIINNTQLQQEKDVKRKTTMQIENKQPFSRFHTWFTQQFVFSSRFICCEQTRRWRNVQLTRTFQQVAAAAAHTKNHLSIVFFRRVIFFFVRIHFSANPRNDSVTHTVAPANCMINKLLSSLLSVRKNNVVLKMRSETKSFSFSDFSIGFGVLRSQNNLLQHSGSGKCCYIWLLQNATREDTRLNFVKTSCYLIAFRWSLFIRIEVIVGNGKRKSPRTGGY